MRSDNIQRDRELEQRTLQWRQGVLAAFGFAKQGVVRSLRLQRNLRIHYAAGWVVLVWNVCVRPNLAVVTLSILTIALVMSVELMNTALEHLTDLATGGTYQELAKWVKDAAAGAVLISSLGAVAVAVWLLVSAWPWHFQLFSAHHLTGALESLVALFVLLWWGILSVLKRH